MSREALLIEFSKVFCALPGAGFTVWGIKSISRCEISRDGKFIVWLCGAAPVGLFWIVFIIIKVDGGESVGSPDIDDFANLFRFFVMCAVFPGLVAFSGGLAQLIGKNFFPLKGSSELGILSSENDDIVIL